MQSGRKEKSLGLLCYRFLAFYPTEAKTNDNIIICLDHMAKVLNVERRRIYDIVNVLESVEILSRVRKNQYKWHGFSNIPHTLSKLKTLALKSNFLEYTKLLMFSQLETSIDLHQDLKQATNVCYEQREPAFGSCKMVETRNSATQTISSTVTISPHQLGHPVKLDLIHRMLIVLVSREEKSLGIMAQKFLMLFLTAEDGLVSINFAARVLLGDSKNDTTELGRFKTKIRRLYDIANVLSSVNLIEKYLSNDSSISKPAYRYIGQEVDVMRDAEYVYDFMNIGNPQSNSKHSLFDHFKRNLDLECGIPKFDINTGILTSKDNKKKRSVEVKQVLNKRIKKEKYDDETFDGLPATTNDFIPVMDNQRHIHQNYQYNGFHVHDYADTHLYYSNQFNSTDDDAYVGGNVQQFLSSSSSNTTEYSSEPCLPSIFYQPLANNVQQANWYDEAVFVDSINPVGVQFLPSFNTFLN